MSADQQAVLYEQPVLASGVAVGAGGTHPCERVFGTCAAGAECPFRDAPREACVAFLKGRCRFADRCREPHLTSYQGKYVSSLHPCLRIYGSCRYGDQCDYANLSADTCVKFLKGRCTFGERCKELHPGAVTSFTYSSAGGMAAMPTLAGMPDMAGMVPGMPVAAMAPYPAPAGLTYAPATGTVVPATGMPALQMADGSLQQYQMQQMQVMSGMAGMVPLGYTLPAAYGAPEADAGVRKRTRDGEADSAGWKRQQTLTPDVSSLTYYQATQGGQMHPCVRIFGTCRDGPYCRFASCRIDACLQYLKGTCKFGDQCHEVHVQMPGQENRQKGPGSKHPCERVYGFCKDGERCRFVDYPAESCVMYLKGKCRFGDACRELHARDPSAALEPAKA